MNNFLNPNIPSWVKPMEPVQQKIQQQQQPMQQGNPQQKFENIMQKLPEPLQQFFQMLSSGDLSSLKGFQGLRPVDHDPFNGNNPFQNLQTQQPFQSSSPFKNIGENINKWGTNDTGLGIYGG